MKRIDIDSAIRLHTQWRRQFLNAFADGAYADVLDRGFLLRAEDGTALRMIGAMQDLTERRVREAAVRQSEERARLATEAAAIGTWDLDIATNRLTCDERFALLFGISAEERRAGINNDAFIGRVHLGDRALVRDSLAETIRAGVDHLHGRLTKGIQHFAVEPHGSSDVQFGVVEQCPRSDAKPNSRSG